jgi:hypothetical protein
MLIFRLAIQIVMDKVQAHTLNINFKDFLVQTNVPDPLCDESWSVGLLRVKILNTTP